MLVATEVAKAIAILSDADKNWAPIGPSGGISTKKSHHRLSDSDERI